MAILRMKEIVELEDSKLESKLLELKKELHAELGSVAAGGRASNPGRIKELRRTIARIKTVMTKRKLAKAS